MFVNIAVPCLTYVLQSDNRDGTTRFRRSLNVYVKRNCYNVIGRPHAPSSTLMLFQFKPGFKPGVSRGRKRADQVLRKSNTQVSDFRACSHKWVTQNYVPDFSPFAKRRRRHNKRLCPAAAIWYFAWQNAGKGGITSRKGVGQLSGNTP